MVFPCAEAAHGPHILAAFLAAEAAGAPGRPSAPQVVWSISGQRLSPSVTKPGMSFSHFSWIASL